MDNPNRSYNFDVSLFERLCISGVPSASGDKFDFPLTQLTLQRRMRPDIADLIRLPLYNNLRDHDSVLQYRRVEGMFHCLYWLNHEKEEDSIGQVDTKETSRSNAYEVEMVTQLVSHLFKQNVYEDGDVAVITPYSGQLRKLQDSLGKTFSVQLSDEDKDEVAVLNPLDAGQGVTSNIVYKPLTKSVRIATVSPLTQTYNIRWIISKAKKPKLLLCLWYVRIRMEA